MLTVSTAPPERVCWREGERRTHLGGDDVLRESTQGTVWGLDELELMARVAGRWQPSSSERVHPGEAHR